MLIRNHYAIYFPKLFSIFFSYQITLVLLVRIHPNSSSNLVPVTVFTTNFLLTIRLTSYQLPTNPLPSADLAASGITAGQLLCGGLFSTDPLSNWFSAVALSHALVGNQEQRTQLLRVQLATSVGNPPVSLLQQAVTILQQVGGVVWVRGGVDGVMSFQGDKLVVSAHFRLM